MTEIIHDALHIVVALVLPPLLLGVIARTKAVFAGRKGPPLLQPYYELAKLFQKGSVLSTTTTWVFLAGPVVGLVTAGVASLLIPLGGTGAPISFNGDMILLAYLLGMGRFFTASAALDTGSPFEGMGAAREVTFACLAEPALFLGLLVLTRVSGSLSLAGMLGGSLASHWSTAGASLALVLLSWLIVLLAENSRIPFDDPNTHLELTMIHEVMVLDHSGPAFGMILYGAALKLFVFGALIVRLVFPAATGSPWVDWPLFTAEMLAVAVVIGVVESTMARLRLTHVPILLVAACLLSGFGMILLVR
ncbi:MAG: NADH-quinone oxidoreductase subunit H [Paludisphaera borealis]|uniref:respiratory chain complex I subunit 1 family protein n=1 Tax=Paludisphaera borealis TaxID=1387353 RepID=UPI002842394B|nr:NADH-quinone oxidoreductase subunit H [Paludisphaera borealis]MDR3618603.1 NADH-quinone oxidoreductase subunit H [Paludisphaera borealis]